MQNSDYLSVFCHLLLPVAYEVRPRICALWTDGQSDVFHVIYLSTFLCHSSAQTWCWCVQALTQPLATQRYTENKWLFIIPFFCLCWIDVVSRAHSTYVSRCSYISRRVHCKMCPVFSTIGTWCDGLILMTVFIFRVKCVPLQTSSPTSLTCSWTLPEANCVLCWRSVCRWQDYAKRSS